MRYPHLSSRKLIIFTKWRLAHLCVRDNKGKQTFTGI